MMKRLIFSLCAILFSLAAALSAKSAPTTAAPEFAYPKKVSERAEKDLRKAIKADDGKAVINALIRLGLAESAISKDNLPAVISRVTTIADNENDDVTRSLLYALLADIYSEIYSESRYIYDQRQIPLSTYPDDIFAWSGDQFKAKINECLTEALKPADKLISTPISDYASILNLGKYTATFYPTLYDFVANKAINTYRSNESDNYQLSQRWLTPAKEFVTISTASLPGNLKDVLTLFQNLTMLHNGATPPAILTDLNRYQFVISHLPTDGNQSSDFQRYLSLFDGYRDNDYAGLILAKACESMESIAEKRKGLDEINRYLVENETPFNRKQLESLAEVATAPKINVTMPQIVPKDYAAKIKINGENITQCTLRLYKLKPTTHDRITSWNSKDTATAKLIDRRTIVFNTPSPCVNDSSVTFTLPEFGYYAIVPDVDGIRQRDERVSAIICSDMAITTLSSRDMKQALVINPATGLPVEEAAVMMGRRDSKEKPMTIGLTDADGCCAIDDKSDYTAIYPSKGNDIYSSSVGAWGGNLPKNEIAVEILTDLPVYHPGDTVIAVAVVYDRELKSNKPRPDESITLELRDVNYNIVDRATATTDQWGRIEARLAVPPTGLTGRFRLQASAKGRDNIGMTWVTVSDYKLPTFELITDNVTSTPGQPVIIEGKAVTYAGFPLESAKVSLSLCNVSPWRWWRFNAPSPSFYTAETSTDDDGRYRFVITPELLDGAPQPDALFVAKLTAISPSGESRDASTAFTNSKSYQITVNMPAVINATKPARIGLSVLGSDNHDVDKDVVATVIRNGLTIGQLNIGTDGNTSFSDFPSGSYSIRFALADTTLTCNPATKDIVVYRPTDKLSPVDKTLWIPETTVIADGNTRKATVAYATASDSTHIYYLASGRDGVVAKGWLNPSKGMNNLEITVPDEESDIKLILMTARDLSLYSETINISTPEAMRKISVNVETFRDKVTPGKEETITLTVKDNSGNPVKAAMLVDMYNKALTQLAPQQFSFSTWPLYTPILYTQTRLNDRPGTYLSKEIRYVGQPSISQPVFNLYGQQFINRFKGIRGYAMMKSAANGLNAVREQEDELAENSAEEVPESVQATDSDSAASHAEETTFAYRDSETPLALFRPMMSTDDAGRLQLSYTVPNANATWTLATLAYDTAMLTSSASCDIIASKPIMVQPNCPRFLRMGDRAVILANVMNATDSAMTVKTRFEIFNPVTGSDISVTESTDSIAPRQAAIVGITIDTPFDMMMLGYRVKSSTATHADGEQGIIPVLESVQPLIESKPFYIAPDSAVFSMDLPKTPAGGRTTLQFCENPAWYIVTALPGLRANTNRTSNSAAAAIFSAAVADGLLRDNPEIKSALHRWLSSDRSDSTLVSMLQRNSDLKIVMLQATPWMMDARSDTERMNRLALLFDKKEIFATYATNIEALAKMQCHGGGWAWTPDYKEPSYWVTMNILEGMGHLTRLGYMPDDKRLKSMVENAVEYIDREAASQFRKYPDGDYTLYVAVRDLFPTVKQSTAAAKVTAATVQKLIAGWKNLNVTDKAIAAIILNNHSYAATARNVMASIDEYAVTSPALGMWWPSLDDITPSRYSKIGAAAIILDAYATVTPSSKAIDAIRQWIVIQKEALDWKDGVITTQVIASFLSTGSKWTTPARGAIVSINGNEITPDRIERITGYFRNDISSLAADGGQLTIVKHGDYPSWGAAITCGRLAMEGIKPASCDAVAIEKTLYKAVNSPDGIRWEATDSYKVGDRVKVDLLIHANRDMDYVAIVDRRGACLEPVEQLPRPIVEQGLYFYRENRDAETNIFIDKLPKGVYRLSYEMNVNNAGRYSAGTASIQSQYAPALSAHSAGAIINVKEDR